MQCALLTDKSTTGFFHIPLLLSLRSSFLVSQDILTTRKTGLISVVELGVNFLEVLLWMFGIISNYTKMLRTFSNLLLLNQLYPCTSIIVKESNAGDNRKRGSIYKKGHDTLALRLAVSTSKIFAWVGVGIVIC